MPITRKKVIKTVYKGEDSEGQDGDFSDSGSDAKFSAGSSSEDEEPIESEKSSGDEFRRKGKPKQVSHKVVRKPKFTKTLINKINKQSLAGTESENVDVTPALFSVKDLTEADKLLPSILNLSESDSSDDESPTISSKKTTPSTISMEIYKGSNSDNEANTEYKDVWSNNIQDDSEEIAKRTFMELEQHKTKIEETKATLQTYTIKLDSEKESNVTDLLALGEEAVPEQKIVTKKSRTRKKKDDSDSEMEDWEEVNESKGIPQQGIQLFVEFPDGGCRKSKKVDVEMMMKRKINRVKKEYQVYMHKVHVLCWLGHGNYVSRILNDQELMAAALSLVPSKECYPGDRVDMKYVEQITSWYKDKLTLKQDKNEDKFKPKAPPLINILTEQIKNRVVTTRKYLVFIFVSMLRALGLQCRVMFNFVTLPMKPPSSELCSLSTKAKDEKTKNDKIKPAAKQEGSKKNESKKQKSTSNCTKTKKQNVSQLDGHDDYVSTDTDFSSDSDFENIMQMDGSNDPQTVNTRSTRSAKRATANDNVKHEEEVSPPKMVKRNTGRRSPKPTAEKENKTQEAPKRTQKRKVNGNKESQEVTSNANKGDDNVNLVIKESLTRRQKSQMNNENTSLAKPKTSEESTTASNSSKTKVLKNNKTTVTITENKLRPPKITVTSEDQEVPSKYFDHSKSTEEGSKLRLSRKRSQTANPGTSKSANKTEAKQTVTKQKGRTKSAPNNTTEKSKYFAETTPKMSSRKSKDTVDDKQRVSHRDLAKTKPNANNDVTGDLVDLIKNRIKDAKEESKKGIVKGKIKKESDEDSDYLPVEDPKRRKSESDDDFKPTKISPKPSTSRKIDRRVLTPDVEVPSKKIDVWCEIFVEELEQWISVDIVKGKIHNSNDFYTNATHPVCYIVGWDNNNYLKDLTRRYVPQWNTVTRKLRAETAWWDKAVQPWLGPKTARDREEDGNLDRMQLEAPLPKSIAEYKNHPLYALKRHLLKFEALYPPDAAVLGFVRGEAVYARECVYVCRSRDTWLKEAKVVKIGEKPYKVVKARPKWDKLSNKVITDKPLEVFGPWQTQEYEPPVAENGIVPRNAYGNVELFKDCMLPKGTVHLKLPCLNRVAKKLNIDCAPAMTGFDFNGGWSHPVYDGFVVCEEFAEVITDAWVKDQEEQERREREKVETRVYGNWKRLIKGLLIRERLKYKYGFEEPATSQPTKGKSKGPKLVVKKKSLL